LETSLCDFPEKDNERKIKLMKNRSSLTIFTTILSVLVCFAFLPQTKAAPQIVPAPDGCYPAFTTAEGCRALQNLGAGFGNTGIGWRTLFSVTDGNYNTGVGAGALVLNSANSNTAVGTAALLLNTLGLDNVAVGTAALVFNDLGNHNTAVGAFALYNNVDGAESTALGASALTNNTSGERNTAIGDSALVSCTSGFRNTALGNDSGNSITDGQRNVVVGDNAGVSIVSGQGNIYIGAGVNSGVGDESAHIRIGDSNFPIAYDCFIEGIYNRTFGAADMAVRVGSNGKLGTVVSSRRFKHDIKPMDKASEKILALKPVSFQYNSDAENTPRFGLIAEDVAEVGPDLVVRDKEGKPLSVRYEDVNVMLLNEFLKEHRKVEQMEKQIEVLAAGLQKVSAQLAAASPSGGGLEASKPASQVVSNP
jgi:hypothetical protein